MLNAQRIEKWKKRKIAKELESKRINEVAKF
jgi:hypothetical protein